MITEIDADSHSSEETDISDEKENEYSFMQTNMWSKICHAVHVTEEVDFRTFFSTIKL